MRRRRKERKHRPHQVEGERESLGTFVASVFLLQIFLPQHLSILLGPQGALEEEVVVRQAYQENETVLDGVATGLKTVAHQSVDDLGRLFGKLGTVTHGVMGLGADELTPRA